MVRRVMLAAVWVSVGAAVVGFVLPWARIDLHEPELLKQLKATAGTQGAVDQLTNRLGRVAVKIRRGAETITGDLPSLNDIPREVSGIQIPQMVNAKNAQVAMALVELFTHERQQLGLKSYAVYLLPGLALLGAGLVTAFPTRRAVGWAVAGVCALLAGVGFWKLLTTDTKTLFIAITIGPGLWLSLWAYVGLAASSALFSLAAPAGKARA